MTWLRSRLRNAFEFWFEGLLILGGTTAALLLWRLARHRAKSHVLVPIWLAVLVLGVLVALIAIQSVWLRRRRGAEEARQITAAYAEHLSEILYAFQRVMNGVIPGVTVRQWIEDGVLEPARDLLKARQPDDVRLSILVPENNDFVMPFAAGHTLESKTRFRLAIDLSFSKWAYRNNTIYWSGDLEADDRFERHPRAAQERGYNSIISLPIRAGDNPVAVFNAIFTPTNAFDEADLLYVRLIGAVLELVWGATGGPVP